MVGIPRSQRLLAFQFDAAGNSPMWVCPQGYVTLVKSVSIYSFQINPVNAYLYVYAMPQGIGHPALHQVINNGNVVFWSGFIVLNPDDRVWVNVDQPLVNCWISGAVLAGPPQFPPATRETVNVLPSDPPTIVSPR